MTPRCPGTREFRHARAAKSHAWATEPDRSKRPVAVQCDDGHWHLVARGAAPDPGGMSAAEPNTDQPGG